MNVVKLIVHIALEPTHHGHFGPCAFASNCCTNVNDQLKHIHTILIKINTVCLCMQILSADGTQEVGVITRQYAGLLKSMFNFEAQHTFGITCEYIMY